MVGRVYMPPDTYWHRRARRRRGVPLALNVVVLMLVVLLAVGLSLALRAGVAQTAGLGGRQALGHCSGSPWRSRRRVAG